MGLHLLTRQHIRGGAGMTACSFTLNGEACTLADPRHYDLHVTEDRERFSDKGSDQGQKAA